MQTGGNPAKLGRFEKPALLVLTSLLEGPRHAHAIVKDVESASGVRLGPGTLYATLTRLEARGLIQALRSDDPRLPYRLTGAGAALMQARLERTGSTAAIGVPRLARV
ncbi:MAG: PadR family transcriptional regulator [Candidatus Dormibacteraeota bacterium]|nr:PadR family transcriptional regulator [Candidatus Dormibacteraeota bacterium]